MYKLVHTHKKKKKKKTEIAFHSIMQHTLSLFLHNIKHVLNQERNIIIHVILKNCLFENFQCFWIFFFFLNKTT